MSFPIVICIELSQNLYRNVLYYQDISPTVLVTVVPVTVTKLWCIVLGEWKMRNSVGSCNHVDKIEHPSWLQEGGESLKNGEVLKKATCRQGLQTCLP